MTEKTEARQGRVLVLDDDAAVCKLVSGVLRKHGCDVISALEPVEGLAVAMEPSVDVAVVDIQMPNLSGLDVLKEIKTKRPEVEVIMMTAYATVETAVQAVKAGAYDYLTKPFEDIADLVAVVRRALDRKALADRNRHLESILEVRERFEGLVGQGPMMQAVFRLVEGVADASTTILVLGESGTGKEMVARAIHYKSARRNQPFLAINCSALAENLLESELFGHVRGAFTGAVANKMGLFEAASGGTLFLDEIGDIPPGTQVRLLRALQEGEVKRVGANDNIRVNTRIVAATNRDLRALIAKGEFREDLFYRLNVIAIELPPLRRRPEDIPLLAHHFLQSYATKEGKSVQGFDTGALELLRTHRWPGNVRELENAIERAVVLATGPRVTAADLPDGLGEFRPASEVGPASLAHLPYSEAKSLALAAFERRYLSTVLSRCGGNISQAAKAAGIDRSNFRRLLRQYDIERPERAASGGAAGEPAKPPPDPEPQA